MSTTKIDDAMQEEIQAILEKNMPKFVCGLVKERLTQTDELQELADKQSARLKEQEEELSTLRHLKEQKNALEVGTAKLKLEQEDLTVDRQDFERDKKVFELTTQLKAQTDMTNHVNLINQNLTRNLEYRKSVFGTKPVAVHGGDGCMGHVQQNESFSENTAETVD